MLKKLIYDECPYKLSDELLDRFMGLMTELHLKNKEALIPYGNLTASSTPMYIYKRAA